MLQIFRTPKYDFMAFRSYAYAFSGAILLASIVGIGLHWRATGDLLNYGIDFRGGTLMQVHFASAPDVGKIRERLEAEGFASASIQRFGDAADNAVLIRVSEQMEETRDLVARIRKALRPAEENQKEQQGLLDLNTVGDADIAATIEREITGENAKSPEPTFTKAAMAVLAARGRQPGGMFRDVEQLKQVPDVPPEMSQALAKHAYVGSLTFPRTESVGPTVGKDLRSKAFFASLVANALILFYLWARFEVRFGVAAVLCLLHDVIFIVGVFAFTKREFDLTVLAAILTVIGYSVNDTVVVFDRIRQNLKLMKKEPLSSVINASINQTLSRTIITSGLTLLVVVALYLYGGPVLNGFAFALLLGIVEGTYSSIFVASPLLLVWQRFVERK